VRSSALALLVLSPALLLVAPARAAEPRAIVEGERFGVVFPEASPSPVRAEGTLDLTVAPGLASAKVRAVYRLTNPGAAPAAGDVTFAVVRGEHEDDPTERIALEVDGAPVEPRALRAADRLAPLLIAWFETHPDVPRQLADPAVPPDAAELRRRVEAAGGRCGAGCSGLLAWHTNSVADEDERLSKDLADDVIVGAAREAIPAAVEALERGLGVEGSSGAAERIGYLVFPLAILPGRTSTVTARYVQLASVDHAAEANATHAFDVLLSPARRWAGFGPLDVTVRVPDHTRFRSPVPFAREGDTYQAALPGLPDGELRFEVMPLDGLWFGMTGRAGYWALLVVAMALAAVGAGAAAGSVWGPGVRFRRVLVPLATAGPIAAVCNFALFVVLFGAFPDGALGFGTAGLVRGLLLVALSLPVGALASAACTVRRRRLRMRLRSTARKA
jgi:hypothetical protein